MTDKSLTAVTPAENEITVLDPQNMFGEAEIGSVGRAYLTPTGDYVVLTCSCPVNLARVKITEDLLKTDASVTAQIERTTDDWILSSYPAVDMPPEFTAQNFGGSGPAAINGFEVEVQNTHSLDAVKDSYVRIKRRTNLEVSVTGNSATEAYTWEIVAVEKKIARWVRFRKSDPPTECGVAIELIFTNGQWEVFSGLCPDGCDYVAPAITGNEVEGDRTSVPCVTDGGSAWLFWDGYEPDYANITWLIADPGCVDEEDLVIACYRPEEHDYIPVSTQSALLGNPDSFDVVTGVEVEDCGLTSVTKQPTKGFKCMKPPQTSTTGGNTQTIQVMTGLNYDSEGLCANLYEVDVCFAAPAGTVCIPVVSCDPPPTECGVAIELIFTNGQWEVFSGLCPDGCYYVAPAITGNEVEGDRTNVPCVTDSAQT
jgi:hypothetical protein